MWYRWAFLERENLTRCPVALVLENWDTSQASYISPDLTLMLLVANFVNTKCCKMLKNDRNPAKWVLIWEYSAWAIQWIPTWQGLDDFWKYSNLCACGESSLGIGRVNIRESLTFACLSLYNHPPPPSSHYLQK